MYLKCLLILFILGCVDAQNEYLWRSSAPSCRLPRIDNGKIRVRPRSKIVKFICNYRYELVGNRYATCRNGQWDERPPVCVRPGCPVLPEISNGLQVYAHQRAWMLAFCLPGYKLNGSETIYCNGERWNGSLPTCVGSTAEVKYSCDFEDEDLCGWTQDELHDFDWCRINKQTPSHYLLTGPSYDHTYGPKKLGHYMYIESTTRSENDTARLLSPIYSASVSSGGCFSFFYHMYGKDIGGLRVYQKPDNIQLSSLLNSSESDKQTYMLFEQWGNLGDAWYSAVVDLKLQDVPFQIVIEGIRGKRYTSDIAIDDVSILRGENCTDAKTSATTPATNTPESCSGRCDLSGDAVPQAGCKCGIDCLVDSNCCFDFIEACLFNSSFVLKTGDDDSSPTNTTIEQPQTQKLVASTVSTSTTTPLPTTRTTPKTTPKPTPKTTPKPTTTTIKTTTRTTSTTTTPKPTTTAATRRTTKATPKPTKTTRVVKPTTKMTPTAKPTVRTTVLTSTTSTTKRPISTMAPAVLTTTDHITYHDMIDDSVMKEVKSDTKKGNSGALKTAVITVVVLACLCSAVMAAVCLRSSRGLQAIARLRGRTRSNQEVRYLTADIDD